MASRHVAGAPAPVGQESPHAARATASGQRRSSVELSKLWFAVELGVYNADLRADRQLVDRDVRLSIDRLVATLHDGPLVALEAGTLNEEDRPEFVSRVVGRQLKESFPSMPRPFRGELIGVLRTIQSSIDVWTTPVPNSRGYLNYVESFLVESFGVATTN